MKKIFIVLCFSLFVNHANAAWSAFAHVTPETESKYKINVSMTPVIDNPDMLSVKFNAVGFDYKLAWLIVAPASLNKKEQMLRSYIWEEPGVKRDILIKTQILPSGFGSFIQEDKDAEKYYQLEIDSRYIAQSYIYIDFPSPVFDGGYYYSIDLGSYYQQVKSSANKSLKQDK